MNTRSSRSLKMPEQLARALGLGGENVQRLMFGPREPVPAGRVFFEEPQNGAF